MRYSIHSVALASLLSLSLLGGCQRSGVAPVSRTNPTPMPVDEAMALRNWQSASALYANGHVNAGPTLFPYEPRGTNPWYLNTLLEPALFIGQTAALPISAIFTPPWQPVAYHGVYLPPTYTADVPLEPIP